MGFFCFSVVWTQADLMHSVPICHMMRIGLHWEEDRDQDEVFECDAVARAGYVFSDYPATPLIDGADCGTSTHTKYSR
eukprot:SAG11_NODE_2107_length_3810_cov_7.214228_5_plen_78_part_00